MKGEKEANGAEAEVRASRFTLTDFVRFITTNMFLDLLSFAPMYLLQ